MQEKTLDVVVDDGRSKLSDLWKKEDYWAIWLGFILILVGYFMLTHTVPEKIASTVAKNEKIMAEQLKLTNYEETGLKTIEWYKADAESNAQRARNNDFGKWAANLLKAPGSWQDNPVDAFILSEEAAKAVADKAKPKAEAAKAALDAALVKAEEAQKAAADAAFKNTELNSAATKMIEEWREAGKAYSKDSAKAKTKAFNIFPSLLMLGAGIAVFLSIGMFFMGHNPIRFIIGFSVVFLVAVLAFMMGGQSWMKKYGFGAEAWAIVIGMVIANTIGTPKFIKPALQVEFFIKTGLVLLGAEVLMDKIIAIGTPGIFVAWVVTPIVLITTFIFGQKVLKIPSKTLNITISADMSVCGTSAAIATAAACRAKKEELTLAVGLSLVFTAIMMIAMPAFIRMVGMPDILGGAWMGGTIDATGAVAAAGAFLGEKAMYVAVTIKMIQNVLIGVTAFGVAVYWCAKVDCVPGQRVSVLEIWNRFPKFVLGFLTASILCSILSGSLGGLSNAMLTEGLVKGWTSPLRGWFFALAFTAIGLATNFRELAPYFKGGKPLILYVVGQSLNLVLTLTMAYIMFYLVFPEITHNI